MTLHNGRGRQRDAGLERARHNRDRALVHPTDPADMAQLDAEEDRRVASADDAAVGLLYVHSVEFVVFHVGVC